MSEELDRNRRYLVPVARLDLPDQPHDVHLSLMQWMPRWEAWATGSALCGLSTQQGALPEGTEATCPNCASYRPTYEAVLAAEVAMDTRTLAPRYNGSPVTVTVTGLPQEAAEAVTRYAERLTQELDEHRRTQQYARTLAYRLAERRSRPTVPQLSDADRLERSRRGEQAVRPVVAEIRIASPSAGGGANLRLFDRNGSCTEHRHRWNLTEAPAAGTSARFAPVDGSLDQGALTAALLAGAEERMQAAGFVRERGARWQAHESGGVHTGRPDPQSVRVRITPTPAYLAFVEAAHGPEPDIPELGDGWSIQRRQRGRWTVRKNLSDFWNLTWQPVIGGACWRVWDERDRTQLLGSAPTAEQALELIGAPLA
ncbi:hypothetical protein ACTWJ8_39835 (plasmid) [Streptomyces sp. SDT5-1]|uniref:hypothetical protein n=1 Tax=Streptomyces sp. SDT5-1 TaxID=3406418 RepID=UPI003FD590F0